MKYKFLIPIALMAAILGGLIFIGANRKTVYTPPDDDYPVYEVKETITDFDEFRKQFDTQGK